MLSDFEVKSLCHMIEEAKSFPCPLHLVACKSVPFFMTFYAAKVTRGMVTFGRSKATKVIVI